MQVVELIPLNKGNCVILDNTITTTIGRTPNIGCLDNKISRNHAQLSIKPDGTVWIKPIHQNPTFYRTKTNQIVTLTKDKDYQLYNDDQFGLLPDEYFYRVSIKSKDEDIEINFHQNQTTNSSTIPKSPDKEQESTPIKDSEISTIKKHDEDKPQTATSAVLRKIRTLPTWMSDSSASTSKLSKALSKEKIVTTPSVKNPTNSREIIYDDDDDEPAAVGSSTEQSKTTISQTSSITTDPNKRERCPYGELCYRKNPTHREQAIHPGDPDWDKEVTDTNKKKPECPYGNECYRKNPDHLQEYHHARRRVVEIKNKTRTSKRKANDDADDDEDDGLPNEYDFDDSFIDDEDLDDSVRAELEEVIESDDSDEWRPHKKGRYSDDTDDSSDESEADLAKQEADEFIKGSTASPVTKKLRKDDD